MKKPLLTIILILHTALAFSQPVTVTVEGVGFLAGGDAAAARDRAIADAQVRAVEQAVGVKVDARAALHKSLLIADTVITHTQGMVRNYKILHEQIDPSGLYRVKLQAEVDPEIMEAQFAAAAGAKRVLLIHPADPPGSPQAFNPLIGGPGRNVCRGRFSAQATGNGSGGFHVAG